MIIVHPLTAEWANNMFQEIRFILKFLFRSSFASITRIIYLSRRDCECWFSIQFWYCWLEPWKEERHYLNTSNSTYSRPWLLFIPVKNAFEEILNIGNNGRLCFPVKYLFSLRSVVDSWAPLGYHLISPSPYSEGPYTILSNYKKTWILKMLYTLI